MAQGMHAFSKAEYTHELTLGFLLDLIYLFSYPFASFEICSSYFRAVNDVL
jgi:hypothetical protein